MITETYLGFTITWKHDRRYWTIEGYQGLACISLKVAKKCIDVYLRAEERKINNQQIKDLR